MEKRISYLVGIVVVIVIISLLYINNSQKNSNFFSNLGKKVISSEITQKNDSDGDTITNIGCPEGIVPTNIDMTNLLLPFNPSAQFNDAKSTDTVFNGYLTFSEKIVYSDRGFRWIEGADVSYSTPCTNWVDGEQACFNDQYPNKKCHHGISEGENINLVYCNNLQYSKTTSNTPISTEGVIGKTQVASINYQVNLILKNKGEIGIYNNNILDKNMGRYASLVDVITSYKVISMECIKS